MKKFNYLKISVLFIFVFMAFSTSIYAAQINWDGGGDGVSWSDPVNWDGDALPTSADNAVFPASIAAPLTVVAGTGMMNPVSGIWVFSGVDLTLDLDLTIDGANAINSVRVFVGSALTFKSGRTFDITSSNRALIFWKENSSITVESGATVNMNAPTGVGSQGGTAVAASLHNYGTMNFTTTASAIRPNNVTNLSVTNYPCAVMNLGVDTTGSKIKFNAPSTLINNGLITYGGNGSAMSISAGGVVINNGFFSYENGSSFGLGAGTITNNGINLNSNDTLVNAMGNCSIDSMGIAAAYDWYSDAAGTNIVGSNDSTGLLTFSPNAFMNAGTQTIYTSCYGSNVAIEVSNVVGDCIMQVMPPDSVNITFLVNTANITVDPTGIFLAGGGNFGDPGDNPMSDADSDGIYEITVKRPVGFSSFYIFTNGDAGWGNKEDIAGLPCSDPNNFDDRFLSPVFSDTTLLTCYETCATDTICPLPPEMVDLTVTVDMSQYGATFTTAYIFGNFNGWNGTANPLSDQGNGLWSGTISVPENDSIEYKFILDDGTVQENFAGGEPCTKTTGNFTNRFLEYSDMNMTLDTVCWESCTACPIAPPEMIDLTLTVNMSQYAAAFTTVYIFGNFNGWNGTANPLTDQGNGLWSGTISVPENDSIEYKFILDDGSVQENFMGGESCTKTTGDFTNRFLSYGDMDMTVANVCWESCADCTVSTNELLRDDNLFTIQPNLVTTNSTTIDFSATANAQKTIRIFNAVGQVVLSINNVENTSTYRLDVNSLQSGLYFINVQTENKTATKRMMIQK